MDDDKVFDALAHKSRRTLLDALFGRDGQTLGELCALLPTMTRFGCMKHLQILEDAGVIVTKKVGREKYHYLNPVPIQLVYDRWVSKYAQPFTFQLSGLKTILEAQTDMDTHTHIFQVYIRTTPERLWQALTTGEITQQYYFGSAVEGTFEAGTSYHYPNPNGGTFIDGQVLEVDPPKRMVCTFQPRFLQDNTLSKVTWEIEAMGGTCRLRLTHDDLILSSPDTAQMVNGWGQILSSLKSLLETGAALDFG